MSVSVGDFVVAPEQVAEFHEFGVTIIRDLFSPAEVAVIERDGCNDHWGFHTQYM